MGPFTSEVLDAEFMFPWQLTDLSHMEMLCLGTPSDPPFPGKPQINTFLFYSSLAGVSLCNSVHLSS